MGNGLRCLKGAEATGVLSDIGNATQKCPEETKFDELTKAVDVPKDKKIEPVAFKYAHLPSIDSFITDAQKTVNKIHSIRNNIADGTEKLIRETEVYLIKDCNTSQAIIGTIYAI